MPPYARRSTGQRDRISRDLAGIPEMGQVMTEASAHESSVKPPTLATVADVMRPPLTTVEQNDHVAAAAYLMKHAGATALTVLDAHDRPIGIITDADIAHAVADGKDVNSVRIHDLM